MVGTPQQSIQKGPIQKFSPAMASVLFLPSDALLAILCRVPAKDQNHAFAIDMSSDPRTLGFHYISAGAFIFWMGGDAGDTPFLLYRKYNPSEFEEDGCDEENLRDDFGELREYDR
jgi:hypothetical protein